MKMLFAMGVVAASLTTAAFADPPVTGTVCTKYEHGVCTSTHKVRGSPGYKVGYVFGPKYSYTALSDLPQPMVVQYKLDPKERYVYDNGYIYVVDPATYAVTKVITTTMPQ